MDSSATEDGGKNQVHAQENTLETVKWPPKGGIVIELLNNGAYLTHLFPFFLSLKLEKNFV